MIGTHLKNSVERKLNKAMKDFYAKQLQESENSREKRYNQLLEDIENERSKRKEQVAKRQKELQEKLSNRLNEANKSFRSEYLNKPVIDNKSDKKLYPDDMRSNKEKLQAKTQLLIKNHSKGFINSSLEDVEFPILPYELWMIIISYVPIDALLRLEKTCRALYFILNLNCKQCNHKTFTLNNDCQSNWRFVYTSLNFPNLDIFLNPS